MCCGSGGERISRHNALRDAFFDTAASAGLAPVKEGRFLLPGADRRPADVLVPHWAAGRDAAMDVTVVHPIQDATMHYRLRGSMGFENYKKWTKVDTCFSFNKPSKQEILCFLR